MVDPFLAFVNPFFRADTIKVFTGEYGFLSNFYPSPVLWNGVWCKTVEHAYQAEKTTDPQAKQYILASETPGRAKTLGRKVKIGLRKDWDLIKVQVMTDLVRLKFHPMVKLSKDLVNTGDRIIMEGNTWNDTFWGVDLNTGIGKNVLGNILMQVRAELRSR